MATTTLQAEPDEAGVRLYNSLRIQRLSDAAAIDTVLDAVFDDGAVIEHWIPKADYDGGCFDVRVLSIAGRSRHTVVRCSRSPITNLHLGNQRGELSRACALYPALVERLEQRLEDARRAFPDSLSIAADVALDRCDKRAYILELNAFGELLPGVVHAGEDTYTAILRAAHTGA
jgi:hypothetical protein